MPRIAQTVTVSTTQEITIKPSLRTKLLKELRQYAALKATLDETQGKMDAIKAKVGDLRDDTGEQSVSLEGFTVTLVAPTRKKFNPKLFVSNGGDLAIYNQSVEEKPTKSYEKITCPGDTPRREEE